MMNGKEEKNQLCIIVLSSLKVRRRKVRKTELIEKEWQFHVLSTFQIMPNYPVKTNS